MQMIHATINQTPEGHDVVFVVHLNQQTDQPSAKRAIDGMKDIAVAFDDAPAIHNLTEWAKPAILADLCKPENPGQSGV